jgi:fructose transport system ATP-binding protein
MSTAPLAEGATGVAASSRPILEARGISKTYGTVRALAEVDIDLYEGEILGLVGDNGAGKSTLIKILSGAIPPDSGQILIDGNPVKINSPTAARAHGVETVYQDLAVVPQMDIAENLFLGREERQGGLGGQALRMINRRTMRKHAADHFKSLHINIKSVRQRVDTLSGGQRQGVAVARSVVFGRRIVIMDEPTAALGVQETQMVVELIERINSHGLAVVLISHNMPQVLHLTHRVMVLRAGRRVGIVKTADTDVEQIVRMITGAEVQHPAH